MDPVFKQLLILMVVVWSVAVMLRRIGLPTIMGELVMGVILGPAVLGWVQPSEIIEILAQLGIFFLMLHAGVETKPREFFEALRASMGIAVVGAMVPFSVSMAVGLAFGLSIFSALFVGLTMTATAVVITIKILQDIGLQNTRMAHVVVASCVIDAILTLVLFSVVLGIVKGGSLDPLSMLWIGLKSILVW
jgi:Kef-type K+ transport system membrane component KefB